MAVLLDCGWVDLWVQFEAESKAFLMDGSKVDVTAECSVELLAGKRGELWAVEMAASLVDLFKQVKQIHKTIK